MSLRRTLYVAPKPHPLPPQSGGSKTQNGRFLSKIALHLKKVPCYKVKVSLCEYCQRQSCEAITGLSICAKMVRRRLPRRENLAETDQPPTKTLISNQYSLVYRLSRNT